MERENPAKDMAKLITAPFIAILLVLVGLVGVLVNKVGDLAW